VLPARVIVGQAKISTYILCFVVILLFYSLADVETKKSTVLYIKKVIYFPLNKFVPSF